MHSQKKKKQSRNGIKNMVWFNEQMQQVFKLAFFFSSLIRALIRIEEFFSGNFPRKWWNCKINDFISLPGLKSCGETLVWLLSDPTARRKCWKTSYKYVVSFLNNIWSWYTRKQKKSEQHVKTLKFKSNVIKQTLILRYKWEK